ncbi:hypothetical protein [Allochromatium tepidum]|uniref:Lipoprotein n=1 Tax=Allochromatium tepidum TaxID=553982 RepID=A0ABM7QQU6_9GAMM|nr:hypothetical protein [Allochromatium tepidum]BCU08399.1 hypothetical protein Atep_30760 [Allochromatium tepidum]
MFLPVLGLMLPPPLAACSCAWRGPFLQVAYSDVPLVIRARVLRHQTDPVPALEVEVLETLAGGLLDSGLVIRMGDGLHCRPPISDFPPGSEWVMALNGPGAKPGTGWALSHCGAYWLRVEHDEVIGSIDREAIQHWPWTAFKRRFQYPRFDQRFQGRVQVGERRCHRFAGRLQVCLEPTANGWEILVHEDGRADNLARLTPPLHSAPNPREIEGWQLLADPHLCASRPYAAQAGPESPRRFVFSPEVGQTVDTPPHPFTAADLERITEFGRGVLRIEDFALEPTTTGCPGIAWMDYRLAVEGGYER